METLVLSPKAIESEHICCAFSDKKVVAGYQAKKEWLKTEYANGYRFRRADARGKVLIEYVPIEHSWLPLNGKNYMVINCFWVSGKFKGNGLGKRLLNECIADAKAAGMDGLVAVGSKKKRPFMSDARFFVAQGFEVVDEAPPFFQLYALRFNSNSQTPAFLDSARKGQSPYKHGISTFYTSTCPFTDYWNNVHLKQYAERKGVSLRVTHLKTRKEARQMPIPWIINSVFYNGELITLELKPDRHLDKLIG